MNGLFRMGALLVALGLLAGCASEPPVAYDYTAFRTSRPASILILPPLNETPEIKAGNGMLAQMSRPLAESGYYVLPVALVSETFRQNGLDNAADIHQVAPARLHEIFGADAALYVKVTEYGASYRLIDSVLQVAAEARLVDLRSGALLWNGSARVSQGSAWEGSDSLEEVLLKAALSQVLNTVGDSSYALAGQASQALLDSRRANGVLPGPRAAGYAHH